MDNRTQELLPDFDPNRKYRHSELNQLTDDLLRADVRSELCRGCGERGRKTGNSKAVPQEAVDAEGNQLVLDFAEYTCGEHQWYQGEGALRGIGGENPFLFEEHLQSRRRREILNNIGTPDPSIVSGMYFKAHPQGRKINSEEARTKHGAGYFK